MKVKPEAVASGDIGQSAYAFGMKHGSAMTIEKLPDIVDISQNIVGTLNQHFDPVRQKDNAA